MSLNGFDLAETLDVPLREDLRAELLESVVAAVSRPDSDLDSVLQSASHVAKAAVEGRIRSVKSYAAKAFFTASKRVRTREDRHQLVFEPPEALEAISGESRVGSPAAIEAAILLEELLSPLDPVDREVYVRHVGGWTHKEIARQLGISVRACWYRHHRAKKRLDQIMSAGR